MARCRLCGQDSQTICATLQLCAACIRHDSPAARRRVAHVHARSRAHFHLPPAPPRDPAGRTCRVCANYCQISDQQVGFCGVRANRAGRLVGGTARNASVSWYHDPLPTNCVADWVCPASTAAGFGRFTDTRGPEHGYTNLAVFYQACSFDCLFCQNWHFRPHSRLGPGRSAQALAEAVDARTRCICYFGGDPTCQIAHAIAASRLALRRAAGRILRICWETNGSMDRRLLQIMIQLSLQTGGCIKFDLKAFNQPLHRALTGASNHRTLENFALAAWHIHRRPDPPLLVAATLLVPGYVEADEVAAIAGFIASLDRHIPYALLAFHPACLMHSLPVTHRRQALACLAAARSAGLSRVRLGNIHLLGGPA
ncbi:MAG: radical SAM protein [Phycisphaerae bacterium]